MNDSRIYGNSESDDQKLDNSGKSKKAVIRSIKDWSITNRYLDPILNAVRKDFDKISYLYVVPFRTKEDNGSTVAKKYIENGHEKHLKNQFQLLAPETIISMDRPSERIAKRFRNEHSQKMKVMYYKRGKYAHSERSF